jgi:hypothetical protein
MQSDPYANPPFIRNVRKDAHITQSSTMLPFSETYRPSKNYISHVSTKFLIFKKGGQRNLTFRISLFRTLQICWMSAADCETFSSELPYSCSSSFWFFEGSTSTPGCITTFRTIFSPMKFLCMPSAPRPPLLAPHPSPS